MKPKPSRWSSLFYFWIMIIVTGFNISVASGQENLSVIGNWKLYTDAPNALYHYLTGQAYDMLAQRKVKVAQLRTAEQWRQRQAWVRETLQEVVGPFPEKTPLHAQVVSTVNKDHYRVENIIFESMPGFHVTGSLFIPEELSGRAPAILFCSGHSTIAYRRPYYQLPLLNLVRKGFVVFAIDPIGQGERLQYYDLEIGASRIGSSTQEHSYPAAQVFLTGRSIARYFTWDGIRAIDYLITRPEVDPGRIGVHGLSGGGTQTAYIMAMDDRVAAAAPAGYITSYKRLMESDGVQDGEQNFYHGIISGLDHGDLVEVRAPKPTLLVTTTRDFFSIQGARETYAEAKQAFRVLGKADNLEMVEDDHTHGYTRKNREAIYAFFQKYLNLPGSPKEQEVEFLTPKELQKTDTGQLANSLHDKTVYDINRTETEHLITQLQGSRKNLNEHLSTVIQKARELSGFHEPDNFSDADVVFTGRFQRQGYVIEKYFLPGEGDYVIPFLLMIPNENRKAEPIVYLHPRGKAAEASPGGEMEWFVQQGYPVLAPDLIGTGEMEPGTFRGDAYIEGNSYNQWFNSLLVGRSIVGVQAGDVVKLCQYLTKHTNLANGHVLGVARGTMSPVLLHAAAFNKIFAKVAILDPYLSYQSIVMNKFYNPGFIHSTVVGALPEYDLPDLAATLAPRPLLIINIQDQNGHPIQDEAFIDHAYKIVARSYQADKAENHYRVTKVPSFQTYGRALESWLEQ